MTEEQKVKVKTNLKVGGISAVSVVSAIAFVTTAFGQIQENKKELADNSRDHRIINEQLEAMRLENNTIKTLQGERHAEVMRRQKVTDDKIDMIIKILSER